MMSEQGLNRDGGLMGIWEGFTARCLFVFLATDLTFYSPSRPPSSISLIPPRSFVIRRPGDNFFLHEERVECGNGYFF